MSIKYAHPSALTVQNAERAAAPIWLACQLLQQRMSRNAPLGCDSDACAARALLVSNVADGGPFVRDTA